MTVTPIFLAIILLPFRNSTTVSCCVVFISFVASRCCRAS
jgi:hypothetical protein